VDASCRAAVTLGQLSLEEDQVAGVKADLARCQGYGNCTLEAPDLFGVDDDGLVAVLRDEFSEDEVPKALSAIRSCPVTALYLTQS
jgi:ferredoxin